MDILQNIWLALNIVFGVWSARNWLVYFYGKLSGRKVLQSELGRLVDLTILSSILAYWFTFGF